MKWCCRKGARPLLMSLRCALGVWRLAVGSVIVTVMVPFAKTHGGIPSTDCPAEKAKRRFGNAKCNVIIIARDLSSEPSGAWFSQPLAHQTCLPSYCTPSVLKSERTQCPPAVLGSLSLPLS